MNCDNPNFKYNKNVKIIQELLEDVGQSEYNLKKLAHAMSLRLKKTMSNSQISDALNSLDAQYNFEVSDNYPGCVCGHAIYAKDGLCEGCELNHQEEVSRDILGGMVYEEADSLFNYIFEYLKRHLYIITETINQEKDYEK